MGGDVVHLADPHAAELSVSAHDELKFDRFTPDEDKQIARYRSWWRGLLGRWALPRAMLTVLTAAVTADSHSDPREIKALLAAVERSKTMRGLSTNAREALFDAVYSSLGLDQWSPEPQPDKVKNLTKLRTRALKKATRTFFRDDRMKKAIFMQALDILRADQTILPSEVAFARHLAVMMAMEENDVRACEDVIIRKNRF